MQEKLRHQLDFEMAYNEVLESPDFPVETKRAFTQAVERTYQQIHDAFFSDREVMNKAFHCCRLLVAPFSASGPSERGFVFTLNQDLFLERFFLNGNSLYDLSIPGLSNVGWFNGSLPQTLTQEHQRILPDQTKLTKFEPSFWGKTYGRFSYLKLHGSYWWRTTEGSEAMVLGSKKTGLIDHIPYIKWSHSVFQEVLYRPSRSLLTIGYGFGDEHINEVIANSIQKHGLKLHIVTPQDKHKFKDFLMPTNGAGSPPNYGETLWNGLSGYYEAKVTDLLTGDGRLTPRGRAVLTGMGL